MVKIYIEGQEWYPVYTIVGDIYEVKAEVSQEFIDRYNKNIQEFNEIHEELEELYAAN